MRVLVVEYLVTCFRKGMAELYSDILIEGYAMAQSLGDLLSWAGLSVTTSVSKDLKQHLYFTNSVEVNPQQCISDLERASRHFDYAVVIAPPRELIEISKSLHTQLLQPSHQLIELLSNKYTAVQSLRECGITVPSTKLIKAHGGVDEEKITLPAVLKPTLLTGAACIEVVKNASELAEALQSVTKCSSESEVVVQEFVEGVHGSILAFYDTNNVKLYSANLQFISSTNRKLKFSGGLTSLRSREFKAQAKDVANKLKKCFPSLYGFVGMDVVWSSGKTFVVEVNPRPTTTIVSLAKLFQELPQGTLRSVILGDSVAYAGDIAVGYSYYVKVKNWIKPPPSVYEESISLPHSDYVIVVGKVQNPLLALDRVKIFVKNLVYNLDAVLLAEAQTHDS